MDNQVVAIIPAAGVGRRMSAGINKIWLTLAGQSILSHVVKLFLSLEFIAHIVIVVNQSELEQTRDMITADWGGYLARISVIAGGKERSDSVANGLRFLENWPGWNHEQRIVVIHDAARALLTRDILQNSIDACIIHKAVGIAVPIKDTIKMVDMERFVVATPERTSLWAVQTPQVFEFNLIKNCYQKIMGMNRQFTDDCSVVEFCGYPVKLIEGSYENFKITTPEDLVLAETILRRRPDADRTGF